MTKRWKSIQEVFDGNHDIVAVVTSTFVARNFAEATHRSVNLAAEAFPGGVFFVRTSLFPAPFGELGTRIAR